MPAPVTMTQLRTRVLRRADMVFPISPNPAFVDTVTGGELDRYINEAAKEFYDLLLAAYGEDYFYASTLTTTVANVATVVLPSNFYKLLGVDATPAGAAHPIALERFNWNERNQRPTLIGWDWLSAEPRYRLRGDLLWLMPTPDAAYPITVHYVPTLADINDTTNQLDGINGWDEFVVLRAAIKCLAKEESDTSALMAELGAAKDRIVSMAPPRDIDKPLRVVDVMATAAYGWDDI